MIRYPNGKKTSPSLPMAKKVVTAARGMELETEINTTNRFYLNHGIAVIHKKPTPVQIVKVDYPRRSAAKIVEAYFKIPSTTDYNGIYKGKYIDFEAKDCHSLTSFPLSSIHSHQIKHLSQVVKHGAIAFVIIRFAKKDEIYYVPFQKFESYLASSEKSSIPYTWFTENALLIPSSFAKPVDYIQVIDTLLEGDSHA